MNSKCVLFLPSNKNHVILFYPIYTLLSKKCKVLYVTQGSYKNEGAEEKLAELGIPFKKFHEYAKNEPYFVMENENVGMVVIGNDTDVIPQWFLNVANKMNVPSILIQDGLLFDVNKTGYDVAQRLSLMLNNSSKKLLKLALKLRISKQYRKISYGQGGCTQIHVWGKATESYLHKRNITKSQIIISGNPKMDQISKPYENKIKNNKNEKLILYAPTDLTNTGILNKKAVSELTNDLCSTVVSIAESRLIIKPHPREDRKFYLDFSKQYGSKIEISNDEISNLISKSDIIITNLSTVSVEALERRKPVIIFLPEIEKIVSDDSFPQVLIKRNVFLYAKNKNDLLKQITKILNEAWGVSDSGLDVISDYVGKQDAHASSNIANSIMEIMSR